MDAPPRPWPRAPLGDVTVSGAGASAAAAGEAATIDGVAKVLVAEDALWAIAWPRPAALDRLAGGRLQHIVAPATTDAKNIMPRVAALLDVHGDLGHLRVVDADTFERPIYAGNAHADGEIRRCHQGRSRPHRRFRLPPDRWFRPVETIGAPGDPGLSSMGRRQGRRHDRPELTSRRSSLSGGRGRRSKTISR